MASQGLEEIYTGGALCFSVLECDWVRFAPRLGADFILGEARSLAATWMKMKGHLVENGAAYSCCLLKALPVIITATAQGVLPRG